MAAVASRRPRPCPEALRLGTSPNRADVESARVASTISVCPTFNVPADYKLAEHAFRQPFRRFAAAIWRSQAMDFSKRQSDPRRHLVGLTFVILFHAFIVYALVTGLAKKVVEVVRAPIETKVIEEIKKQPTLHDV